MMKLLVSDYDDTFKSSIKNLNINIKAINEFMEAGNKFAIATGREYKSIKAEIDCYDIKYDYLICNNGLITFDSQNNIIDSMPLTTEDLNFICDSVDKDIESRNFKLFNFYSSTIIPENILEVCAKFNTIDGAIKYKTYLESIKPHIKCSQEGRRLYIGNCSNKAMAISHINYLEKIEDDNVYTIGDNLNDIEMLEEFNGYKMLKSNKKLWFRGIPTARQVHSLVKKLNKKN